MRLRTVSVCRFAIVALALLTCSANAQESIYQEPWRWSRFDTESGLPSEQVYDVVETRAGTIWAGTQAGLAWFDHYQWHAFDSSHGMQPGPVSRIVPFGNDSILVVSRGALYCGTRDTISLLVSPKELPGYVQAVVPTPGNGILVLGTEGLYRYFNSRLDSVFTPAHPMSNGPTNLWRTKSGKIWVNTVTGLYRLDKTSWNLIIPAGKFELGFLNVFEDAQGNGLAALSFPRDIQGIWEWSRHGSAVLSATERLGLQQSMDVAPNGDVVVVYESGDVRIRHKQTWSSVEPRPPQFTSTHVVRFRKDGDLWVGTDRGLYLFRSMSRRWTYWYHPFADLRNGVHEIARTSDGSIWLGTLRGLEIHKPGGQVEYIERILGTELGTVTAVVEDNQRNVWIGSGASFHGVFRWDGRAWKHFGAADGLVADQIHKIRKDRSGRLWFLGLGSRYANIKDQPGAFLYEKGKFVHWPAQDSAHEGLINGRVYGFVEGFDGSRWFATYGGLSRWKDGTWTHWTRKNGLRDENNRIYAIALDSSGTVWFSNVGAGLGMVDSRDSVHYFTIKDGLINNDIWDIKTDDGGALWMSTKLGLSRLKDGMWSSFTIWDGLRTSNLWDILATRDRIYVGSPGAGVNILSLQDSVQPPRVQFAVPSVQGTTALMRWKVFPYFGEMNPEEVQTRFRCDSLPWSTWTTRNEVYLSGLSSGDHTFSVQAKGLFGITNGAGEIISFHVEPHLYQQWTFLIPFTVLATALIALGSAYWSRKRKYTQELKQSEERFRLLSSSTTDLIYDWNLQADLSWSNDPLMTFTPPHPGSSQTYYTKWLDTIHPDDREQVDRKLQSALAEKSLYWQAEYRKQKPDGTTSHYLHRGHLLYNSSGLPARVIGSVMDITERKQSEELSRDISRRVIEAQEGERRRVSRELHDSVNQILASVKFRIESLEELLPPRMTRIRRETRKTKQLLNKVMTEIRRISRNLRPAELDDLGLASAVRSLAEEFVERTKIKATIERNWPERSLTPEVRLTLYRIFQEALTNIEKHARATHVNLSCVESDGDLVCVIKDNGAGMRTDESGKSKSKRNGLGLHDMRERLSYLGGTLQISSKPRRGTTITARVPLTTIPPAHSE